MSFSSSCVTLVAYVIFLACGPTTGQGINAGITYSPRCALGIEKGPMQSVCVLAPCVRGYRRLLLTLAY